VVHISKKWKGKNAELEGPESKGRRVGEEVKLQIL
jgi:hypothetical protein